jgi:hypothetical protein
MNGLPDQADDLHPKLDSIRHLLEGVEIPCPKCSHPRIVEVVAEQYLSCRPRLEECNRCGDRENALTAEPKQGEHNGASNIHLARNAESGGDVQDDNETVCLETEDYEPEAMLEGPNLCVVCGCDPCQFIQFETNILEQDRIHNKDVGINASERNSTRRKCAYKLVTRLREGVLGRGVRKPLPNCILDGVRSLFPPMDGVVMGFMEE